MERTLEELLYTAIIEEDRDKIITFLSQGANPNKITCHGQTCLGQAASKGNVDILKLLIDNSYSCTALHKTSPNNSSIRKPNSKPHKRKLRNDLHLDEVVAKTKNLNDSRTIKDCYNSSRDQKSFSKSDKNQSIEKNQGYFVFNYDEDGTDESQVSQVSVLSSMSPLTPSPQADLEWDEEIGNVAASTSEDETWSSLYKWYAKVLEHTGAALLRAAAAPAGIDQQDSYLRTATHYAAEKGHVPVLRLLIDSGCKVDIAAGDGLTPLHVAIIRNHIDVVKILLASGSQINYKTYDKTTALHFASSRGHLDMVKILVNAGAHLEARDTNERTALYLAAARGLEDVVKYLISVGANVNGEEIHGYTPLCEAVWQGYTSVVNVLLSSGARTTHSHNLLHYAVMKGQQDMVATLAKAGAGINLHNDNGDTPLLLAVRLQRLNIVRLLVKYGANINSCNSITCANALHIIVDSVCNKDLLCEMIFCLLELGIDIDHVALSGDTALNRALLMHRNHAVALLVKYGADVNACDLQACALDNLTLAVRLESVDVVRLLVKAGHKLPPSTTDVPPDTGTASNWLYHACRRPLSLLDLCRIFIRKRCDNMTMHKYIYAIPLPPLLRDFLMFEDEYTTKYWFNVYDTNEKQY
ncbi:Ankyrin-3 [Eumeta japonica]|uniref:Ankyrin-3 n=1 Tax=Eumeta variegata TaxID=151549 RepID=A0A4C1UC57_EUMVA|nr:Ankyrin-3 [Eumeta japonica]